MKSQRVRIQKFLIALARDSEDFHAVNYQTSSGTPALEPDEVDFGQFEQPSSVLCNEVAATFDTDSRHGRSLKRERTSWTFELRVKFDKEVTVEKFEDKLLDSPPFLAKDEAEDLSSVRFDLQRTEPTHPVKHEGHAGTRVRFLFRAELGRN